MQDFITKVGQVLGKEGLEDPKYRSQDLVQVYLCRTAAQELGPSSGKYGTVSALTN